MQFVPMSDAASMLTGAENLNPVLSIEDPLCRLHALWFHCEPYERYGIPSRYFSSMVVLGSLNHSWLTKLSTCAAPLLAATWCLAWHSK